MPPPPAALAADKQSIGLHSPCLGSPGFRISETLVWVVHVFHVNGIVPCVRGLLSFR